jgi:hypothetical protein
LTGSSGALSTTRARVDAGGSGSVFWIRQSPAIGGSCRNFERRGAKTSLRVKISEKKRFRVDAFWQKAYFPARQSTASYRFAENLTSQNIAGKKENAPRLW